MKNYNTFVPGDLDMPELNKNLSSSQMTAKDANEIWYLVTQDPRGETENGLIKALARYKDKYKNSLFLQYCEWYAPISKPERKAALLLEMLDRLPKELHNPRTAEEAYIVYQFCFKIKNFSNDVVLTEEQQNKLKTIEALKKNGNDEIFVRKISLFRDFAPLCHVLGAHYSMAGLTYGNNPYAMSDKQLRYLKMGQAFIQEAAHLGFFPASADYILNVFNYPAFASGQGEQIINFHSSEFLMQNCVELIKYVDDKTKLYIKSTQQAGERIESFSEFLEPANRVLLQKTLAFQLAALALFRLLNQAETPEFSAIDRKSPLLHYIESELKIAAKAPEGLREAFAMQALLAHHFKGGIEKTKELLQQSNLLNEPSENDIWLGFEPHFQKMCLELGCIPSLQQPQLSLAPQSDQRSTFKELLQREGIASPLPAFHKAFELRSPNLTTPNKMYLARKPQLSTNPSDPAIPNKELKQTHANLMRQLNEEISNSFSSSSSSGDVIKSVRINKDDLDNFGYEWEKADIREESSLPAESIDKTMNQDQFNALVYMILEGFERYKSLGNNNKECFKIWKALVEKIVIIANNKDAFASKAKQILQVINEFYGNIEKQQSPESYNLLAQLLGQLLANYSQRPKSFTEIKNSFPPKKYSFLTIHTDIKDRNLEDGKIYLLKNQDQQQAEYLQYIVKNGNGKITRGTIDDENQDIKSSELSKIISVISASDKKLDSQQKNLLLNALASEGHIDTYLWADAQMVSKKTVDALVLKQTSSLKSDMKEPNPTQIQQVLFLIDRMCSPESKIQKDARWTELANSIAELKISYPQSLFVQYQEYRMLKTRAVDESAVAKILKAIPNKNKPNATQAYILLGLLNEGRAFEDLGILKKDNFINHVKKIKTQLFPFYYELGCHLLKTKSPTTLSNLINKDHLNGLAALKTAYLHDDVRAASAYSDAVLTNPPMVDEKGHFYSSSKLLAMLESFGGVSQKNTRPLLAYRLAKQLLELSPEDKNASSKKNKDKIRKVNEHIKKELIIACWDPKHSAPDALTSYSEYLKNLGQEPAEKIKASSMLHHITYAVLDFYAAYKKKTNPHHGWLSVLQILSDSILTIYQSPNNISDANKQGAMLECLKMAYHQIDSKNSRTRHFLGDLLDCCGDKPENFKSKISYRDTAKKDFLQEAILRSGQEDQLDKVIVGRHLCLELINKLSAIKHTAFLGSGLFKLQDAISPMEEHAKNQLIAILKDLLKKPEIFKEQRNPRAFLSELVHKKLDLVSDLYQKNGQPVTSRLDNAVTQIDQYLKIKPQPLAFSSLRAKTQYDLVRTYVKETTERYHKFGLKTNTHKLGLAYELLQKLAQVAEPDGIDSLIGETIESYANEIKKPISFFETKKFGAMLKSLGYSQSGLGLDINASMSK